MRNTAIKIILYTEEGVYFLKDSIKLPYKLWWKVFNFYLYFLDHNKHLINKLTS